MKENVVELELFKKNNFDEILKTQIEEVAHFKQIIAEKDELISRLNDELFSKNKSVETALAETQSNKLLLAA